MRFLLLSLLTVLVCSQCNSLRILGIFPLNGRSHWSMTGELMINLAKRGHHVDVITHFLRKNPPPNYKEISLDGSLPPVINNMNASLAKDINTADIKHLMYMAGDQVCNLLGHPKIQELVKNPPKEPYDVIVSEVFLAPCYLIFGTIFKRPIVNLLTSSFHEWENGQLGNPHNPSYMPCTFSSFSERMTFWERLQNTFLTNLIVTQISYHTANQVDYVKKYFGLNVTIPELHKNIAATLSNTHHSFHGIKPFIAGFIEVGGLHVQEDSDPLLPEVQKWLDESTHGCIYFTFGSMVRFETFPENLVKTFYEVFEKIAPVRVLMKIAKKEELPPGLPKNVMTQSWFPQVAVFRHKNVKAFITHGGLMSMQEAIFHEIPMIGIPMFGDQFTNLKIASSKKVAVNLGSMQTVTKESLSNAINAVLHDESFRTNMKKLSYEFKDRPMKPMDTAIYWIEYVARHGYILQSPAIHLTWVQQSLLDVYGFVLLILAIIIAILIYLYKKFMHKRRHCKKQSKSSEHKKKK